MENKAKQFWANKNLVIAILAIILAFILGTLVGGHGGRGYKDMNRMHDRDGYKQMNDNRGDYNNMMQGGTGMMQNGQNMMNGTFEKTPGNTGQAPAPTTGGAQPQPAGTPAQ